MSQAHQYLLLYVLDLLSVFARKSDKNLMTAQNLAVIFRPGILSHPSHEMAPQEHALSQRVLEFLIASQDWFMLDTPTPNLSLVSPHLPSSTTTPPVPPPSAPVQPPPSAYDHTRFASGGGVHWRTQTTGDEGANGGWAGGAPTMTEREIQREQERIKMMRRRTTLERGEPGVYGTLEEGLESGGESPTTYHNSNNPTLNGGAVVGVTRSRTLPSSSSRSRRAGGAGGSNPNVNVTTQNTAAGTTTTTDGKKEERERSRLMKKQKRASMATPSQTSNAPSTTTTQQRRTSQILRGSSGL
ncbi:GTPase-activating protein SAC7 [Leucoagaricus sp. SymC.cos]|nr:GTPase-activating protein SAC7 [Leucoagaricus sp. SymC.cos]